MTDNFPSLSLQSHPARGWVFLGKKERKDATNYRPRIEMDKAVFQDLLYRGFRRVILCGRGLPRVQFTPWKFLFSPTKFTHQKARRILAC